jgi:hypothetical protein
MKKKEYKNGKKKGDGNKYVNELERKRNYAAKEIVIYEFTYSIITLCICIYVYMHERGNS